MNSGMKRFDTSDSLSFLFPCSKLPTHRPNPYPPPSVTPFHRISSTPNVIRLVLTVCRGVRDVQVDANANAIRVLPLRTARHGPDSVELIQHLDELGLGLTFVVAPPHIKRQPATADALNDTKRQPTNGNPASDTNRLQPATATTDPLAHASVAQKSKRQPASTNPLTDDAVPVGKLARNGGGKTATSNGGNAPGSGASNERKRGGAGAGAGASPPPSARGSNGYGSVGGHPGVGVAGSGLGEAGGGGGVGGGVVEVESVMPNVVLEVEGMMCQKNCGSTVKAALDNLPGVAKTEVSFAEKRARVWGSDGGRGFPSAEELVEAVEAVGFGAEVSPDVVLEVEGMMCQNNCGTTVRKALESVPGVARVEVSFPLKRAKVWTDVSSSGRLLRRAGFSSGEGEESDSPLVIAVESVGFEAAVAPTAVLAVEGMMCQRNCGTTVTRALESIPGVSRAQVSFADKSAKVWATPPGGVSLNEILDAVTSVGFDATVADPNPLTTPAPASADSLLPPRSAGENSRRVSSGSSKAADSDVRVLSAAVAARVGVSGSSKEAGKGREGGGLVGAGGGLSVGVFSVEGMSCAACVGNVERFVGALRGVGEVRVALLAGQVGACFFFFLYFHVLSYSRVWFCIFRVLCFRCATCTASWRFCCAAVLNVSSRVLSFHLCVYAQAEIFLYFRACCFLFFVFVFSNVLCFDKKMCAACCTLSPTLLVYFLLSVYVRGWG